MRSRIDLESHTEYRGVSTEMYRIRRLFDVDANHTFERQAVDPPQDDDLFQPILEEGADYLVALDVWVCLWSSNDWGMSESRPQLLNEDFDGTHVAPVAAERIFPTYLPNDPAV